MPAVAHHRLAASLGVERGEGLIAALLFAISFFTTGSFVLGSVAGSALALAAYGPIALPYSYVITAAVLLVAGAAFGWAEPRFPLGRLLIGPWAALVALGGAIYGGLLLGGPAWLTFALLCWALLCFNIGDLAFWALAGRLLNLEQGKRLFGLISSGLLAARLVLFTASGLIVGLVGTVNLTVGALAAALISLLLLVAVARRYQLTPAREARAPQPRAARRRPRRPIRGRRRYITLIVAVAFFSELVGYLGEFLFFHQASLAYPSADAFAEFFGLYAGAVSLLATLVGVVLARPILRRLGVRGGLLIEIVCGLLAIGVVLALALVGPPGAVFAAVLAFDAVLNLSRKSISRPSGQLLFQPIPSAERLPVQNLTQNIMEPLALGACGAILIAFYASGGIVVAWLAGLILALMAARLVLTLAVVRGYVAALGRALARSLVGAGTVQLDSAGLAVIERALGSPRPIEVLSALDMLRAELPDLYAERLPRLLGHPDPLVRREVVSRVAALRLAAVAPELAAMVAGEVDAPARAAAVAALSEMAPPPEQLLADASPEVRCAAVVGLLRHGSAAAAAALAALRSSAAAAERALAASVAGASRDSALLAELLADPAVEVRRAALLASGPWAPEPIWRAAVRALDDRHCRAAAAAALSGGGAAAMPVIAEALGGRALGREARLRLVKVCGRIEAPGAAEALARMLDAPDDELRDVCVRALRRRGYRAGADERRVRARLSAEAEQAAETAAALADLKPHPEAELLHAALAAQLARQRRRLLSILGFLLGRDAVRPIEDGLASPVAERRAYALELIETRVPADLRAAVAPALADAPPRGPRRPLADRLAAIASAPESAVTPWMRACAAYTAELVGRPGAPAHGARPALRAAALAGDEGAGEAQVEEGEMLTIVERVITLKRVEIFAAAPDAALADLAELLEEEEAPAEQQIFARGEVGSSLYIVAAGEVRVHDGEVTFNHLGDGQVFGEMAVLDPAPRSASVTAVTDTLLLRLDAEPFYELMDDHPEIARSVISVISGRLRERMLDLQAARNGAG